jgi:microcystin degradation protein MlrC
VVVAGGNTTTLLKALVEANARSVLVALITDPALAQEAHHLGVGQAFVANFNRHHPDPFATPYTAQAKCLLCLTGISWAGAVCCKVQPKPWDFQLY